MDDGMLKRMSQVMNLQEKMREKCAAIIVPQLLTNMLLLEILDTLQEMKELNIKAMETKCETWEESPKRGSKATPLKRAPKEGKSPKK